MLNGGLLCLYILKLGVKQCDPSSSLLCLFFMNDIIQHINTDKDGIMTLETLKMHLLFFADDASFLRKIPAHYNAWYLTSKRTVSHGIWS